MDGQRLWIGQWPVWPTKSRPRANKNPRGGRPATTHTSPKRQPRGVEGIRAATARAKATPTATGALTTKRRREPHCPLRKRTAGRSTPAAATTPPLFRRASTFASSVNKAGAERERERERQEAHPPGKDGNKGRTGQGTGSRGGAEFPPNEEYCTVLYCTLAHC